MVMMKDKLLVELRMLEAGIVPPASGSGIEPMLQQLSAADRRTARRKFRKLWRKACRHFSELEPDAEWSDRCGLCETALPPDSSQRRARRRLVRRFLSELIQTK